MMKSNDGIPSTLIMRMKVRIFLSDTLNKYIPRKKMARLLNEESSSHFEVF